MRKARILEAAAKLMVTLSPVLPNPLSLYVVQLPAAQTRHRSQARLALVECQELRRTNFQRAGHM